MRRRRLKKKRPVIDKSKLAIPTQGKIEDEKYRRWISSLPCCVTRLADGVQCIHIRFQSGAGAGEKPSDHGNCLPLHWEKHNEQHSIPETEFWERYGGIDLAKRLASDLFKIYQTGGDYSSAVFRIMAFQRGL